jgi:4-amino-4-deoxy-L-arabinose transferase-like glycosyltransferase
MILALAAIAFASLVTWSRERDTSASAGWLARLQIQAARAPQSTALIGASIICGVAAFWFDADPQMLPWPTLLAWATGIVLLLVGAWRLGHEPTAARTAIAEAYEPTSTRDAAAPAESPDAAPSEAMPQPVERAAQDRALDEALVADPQPYARWEILALVALTIIALLARALLLDSIPHNFAGDEGEMGMMARDVLSGVVRDPFATGWLSHPTLWFFMQSLALRVFGDNVFGLRMLSALIGTATVPALYFFSRLLYGRTIALTAAALLAIYHMHIHFSRIALNNIVDPLLLLIAFAAFLHGYRNAAPFSFALSGVALGLAQHFYMGARLAPLVLLVVLAHQFLLARRRVFAVLPYLPLMALGFVLGFGPLLRYFLLHPNDFIARLTVVGIFPSGWVAARQAEGLSLLQIMLFQARGALGGFIYEPDHSAFYDPQMPLLDRTSAILFILGLTLVIHRWRRIESALLLAWVLGVMIFGGMLLIDPPQSARYVIAAPAMCLLIGLALTQIAAALRWALPLTQRHVAVLGAAAVLLLALWNINFYFREYTPRDAYGWLNTEVATDIGTYLQRQPDKVFVYFFGPPRMFITNGSVRFIATDVPSIDVLETINSPDMLPPLPPERRPIFIFLPERAGELAIVQGRYPNGTLRQVDAVSEQTTLYLSYEPK